jgi:hypothetical protein
VKLNIRGEAALRFDEIICVMTGIVKDKFVPSVFRVKKTYPFRAKNNFG